MVANSFFSHRISIEADRFPLRLTVTNGSEWSRAVGNGCLCAQVLLIGEGLSIIDFSHQQAILYYMYGRKEGQVVQFLSGRRARVMRIIIVILSEGL